MNIHLFVNFGGNTDQSPIAKAFRKNEVTLTVFSNPVGLKYKRRIWLYLSGWPRTFFYSYKIAKDSITHEKKADVIVVNSHFDILALIFLSKVLFKKLPIIVFPGFIYTQHNGKAIQIIKFNYYRWIITKSDIVICHSEKELDTNNKIFTDSKGKFVFIPYAMHVWPANGFEDDTIKSRKIISAGRSERDYPTLIKAVANKRYLTNIICDYSESLKNISLPENIKILDNCYGKCYFSELRSARLVVVPLASLNISAGQMVILQAMAFGKPIIATLTETSMHYIKHMETGLLVKPEDTKDLEIAIDKIMKEDKLCIKLGKQAALEFQKTFSIEAYASNLISIIQKYLTKVEK